jgi:hypothetical protein
LAGNLNFGGKFKFWREIQILAGNSNFGGKFKFWREIQILAGNFNFPVIESSNNITPSLIA